MAMKRKYKKKEEIPAEHAPLYTERNGEFILEVEGDETPASTESGTDRLAEFRQNNANLMRDLQERDRELGRLRKQYEGVDVEKYKKATAMIEKITADEERELLAQGRIEEVVQRRTQVAIANASGELKQLQSTIGQKDKELETLRDSLGKHVIERDVQLAISKKGVRPLPGALADILARTNRGWRIDDKGNARPIKFENNGEVVTRYGSNGQVLNMDEYVDTDLIQGAPHLFEKANGGNSPGSDTGAPNDGIIRIKRGDAEKKSKYLKELADGRAKLVD